MTPEGLVKNKVKALLKSKGAWFFMPAMGSFGRAGVADIVGIHNGRGFAVECKAGKNWTTALQEIELCKVRAAGGFAIVVNETEGWALLEAFLRG